MVTNLQTFHKDGLELIINTETGESFASVSGYARISGKAQSTISARLSKLSVIMSEVLTNGGVQSVRLITEDLMVEWLPKDNPEMATKMMKAGIRVFLHLLAGFDVKSQSQSSQRQLPQRDAIEYIEATEKLSKMEDCILTRLLKSALVDELALRQNNNLLPNTEVKHYTIVKVRAKDLGYTETQIGDGSALGRFVKGQVKPQFQEQIGQFKVWHYEINQDLDNAIHAYFS
jgi:hypothetical protein